MKRVGRAPTLVLCSRNARPENGLVRRPHLDQHECPSIGEKRNKLGRMEKERPGALLARSAPTMKRWSFDARSEGQSGDSLGRKESMKLEGPRQTGPYSLRWLLLQIKVQRPHLSSTNKIMRLSHQRQFPSAKRPVFLTSHLAEFHGIDK